MKKQMVFILLLLLSATSFGQTTEFSKTLTNSDYLKKSKKQNTAAWIFLGSGFGVSVAGLVVGVVGTAEEISGIFTGEKSNTFEAGAAIFYVGLAAMLTSIPFFIASSKNKKSAAGISAYFKFENSSLVKQGSMMKSTYPALALKLNL